MYGHAAGTLTPCADCPPWQPHWASVRTDDGRPVCVDHYRADEAQTGSPA